MNLSIDKQIRIGYVTAFVLLLFAYILIFYTNRQMQLQTKLVMHTNQVINQIEVVLSDIKDGETGMRGYLAMKDKMFLAPFFKSQNSLPKNLQNLKVLVVDNYTQLKILDAIKLLATNKYVLMDNVRQSFDKNNLTISDATKLIAYRAKVDMDTIRVLAADMRNNEIVLLASRTNEMDSFRQAVTIINITTLIIAMLLAIYSYVTYNKENKQKNIYRTELEKKIKDLINTNTEIVRLKFNEKFAATGRIARTIAHEVRNPLTNIALASEQIREISSKDADSELYFDMIKRNCERINVLVSELLNATKLIELKPVKLSINTILDEALDLAKDRVQLQHLKVVKNYSNDVCEVLVDREQIKIALLNLIVNAIEAIEEENGELILETKGKNGKCVIVIRDNGIGISTDNLPNLFEPYFTNKENGNGLGLTNTQNIILNHKGNIHVESELGRGTEFTVTLDFAS